MQLNSTEIAELIKKRIAQFDVTSEARNEGTIVAVTDGIIRIHGLADVMQGEMIELPGGRYAIALNLERDSVGAVVMGPYADLQEGQKVQSTGRILEVPVVVVEFNTQPGDDLSVQFGRMDFPLLDCIAPDKGLVEGTPDE